MEIIIIIVSFVILLVLGMLFYKINALSQKPKEDNSLQLLQQQMEGLRSQFITQLGQISEQTSKLYADNQNTFQKVNSDINSRLDNAAKVIGDVHRKLGEVHETTRQVQEVGKDIASLQEILRAPKIRGGMGELFLADLLKQVLPPSRYELQHYFKSREAVDAVIILKEGMVPIDSKFPLENFKKIVEASSEGEKTPAKKQFIRDVKKHIDAIASKYILPDEKTFDFALMYIPAENVYYETIIKDENLDEGKSIFQYALEKRVLPVSPNSFYAYLQTILLGLRGMRIEAQAQEILQNIARLTGDFGKITEDFSTMGTHLKHLTASYESTDKRLNRFNDKLVSLEEKENPALPLQ